MNTCAYSLKHVKRVGCWRAREGRSKACVESAAVCTQLLQQTINDIQKTKPPYAIIALQRHQAAPRLNYLLARNLSFNVNAVKSKNAFYKLIFGNDACLGLRWYIRFWKLT